MKVTKASEMKQIQEICAEKGKGILTLTKMSDYYDKPEKLRNFMLAELEPGASVGYHVHNNESESYYILSGEGVYNDDGEEIPVKTGDVTFTPDGHGHGIENTGSEPLKFIALIIRD